MLGAWNGICTLTVSADDGCGRVVFGYYRSPLLGTGRPAVIEVLAEFAVLAVSAVLASQLMNLAVGHGYY
jgi:hypothetical protein